MWSAAISCPLKVGLVICICGGLTMKEEDTLLQVAEALEYWKEDSA